MRRSLLLLAAALAVSACQDSPGVDTSLAPTDANVAGTFNLYTANGQTLPYIAIITTTEVWNLVSDKITISANNTWTDTTNYSIQNRQDGSVSARGTASGGTWSISSGKINFIMTSGGTINFTGSVAGNTLTAIFEGKRYYYSR